MGLIWLLFLNKVTFDVSVTLEQCPQEQAEFQKRSVLYLKSVNWNMHVRKLFTCNFTVQQSNQFQFFRTLQLEFVLFF